MSLIDHFNAQLTQLPPSLRVSTQTGLSRLAERLPTTAWVLNHPPIANSLLQVISCCQFVLDSLLKMPELLNDPDFLTALVSNAQRDQYASCLAQGDASDEASVMRTLRRFRRQEMLRIAWRDLAGWADLAETLLDLSQLAEVCIQWALAYSYQQQCARKGTPLLKDGTAFNLVVLGMGKLGAYELNFSSDIDLIFAYAEAGELADSQQTSYHEFFTRVAQQLVKLLDAQTEEGFVFRTDTRLRPFGDSGPLLMTFAGMEHYYQTQAREWERYAMVKVRQVAGDFNTGAQLLAMFKPFVYRRYLDYGAFEELRSLKTKITQELRRKDRLDNIKLGPGGIREIEFIGQAFQLIRGGQEQRLQQRGILAVLQTLAVLQLLSPSDAQQLQAAYQFLRRVENHIQAYQDQQTHDLPTDPQAQAALAYSLAFPDWPTFIAELTQVRQQVHAVFEQVFALSKAVQTLSPSETVWAMQGDDEGLAAQLTQLGFAEAGVALKHLQGFKQSTALKQLTSKGAAVIERLLPQVLARLGSVCNPDETLKRLLNLFEAVAGRNVYLALLAENPEALTPLIKLSAASAWLCDYLARYPALFDELLDTRSLFEPLQKADLAAQLQALLQRTDCQDFEQYLIALRKFKQINVLRVAAADIMGVIPLMVVSDYLTYIAEVLVAEVLAYVWQGAVEKHGRPPGASASIDQFGVIGFGKLGGVELSYGSDLDLVFLYDCPDGMALTDGAKAISCAQFYGRIGLQFRLIMETRMLSGVLYEVDLRLRPHGDSGLLVSQLSSYQQYQLQTAWTWEHQALVRARFIAGDPEIAQGFAAIRQQVLTLPRDLQVLKAAVREMREKMRTALAVKQAGKFDLKQSAGGIADIEFIVQFGVLAYAAVHPDLTHLTGTIRLLTALAEIGFITAAEAALLQSAYCRYRDLGHQLLLQGQAVLAEAEKFITTKAAVERVWDRLMR